MRPYAREHAAEVCAFGGEIAECPGAHNAVRVVAKQVVPVCRKLARFHQLDREVVTEVPPDSPAARPVAATTPALAHVPVPEEPGEVERGEQVEARAEQQVHEQQEGERAKGQEGEGVVERRQRLQPPVQGQPQRRPFDPQEAHAATVSLCPAR